MSTQAVCLLMRGLSTRTTHTTHSSFPPGVEGSKRVVTFKERKKTAKPSAGGLYPAEVLLLDYCSRGDYPKPRNGYPGFWWFKYGVRDVGHKLESLETRGFIKWAPKAKFLGTMKVSELKALLAQRGLPTNGKKSDLVARIQENIASDDLDIPDYVPKYELTEAGHRELTENGYVPYLHRSKWTMPEGSSDGGELNIWGVNQRLAPGADWIELVAKMELKAFGSDMVHAAMSKIESTAGQEGATRQKSKKLDPAYVEKYLKDHHDYVQREMRKPGDGFEEEMRGIELKKDGKDDEALVQFAVAIAKGYDAPALYKEAAILMRRYRLYDREVKVLKAGLRRVPKSNSHWNELNERLARAEELASKEK